MTTRHRKDLSVEDLIRRGEERQADLLALQADLRDEFMAALDASDIDLAETLAVQLENHAERCDINKKHLRTLFKKSMDNTMKRVRSLKPKL